MHAQDAKGRSKGEAKAPPRPHPAHRWPGTYMTPEQLEKVIN